MARSRYATATAWNKYVSRTGSCPPGSQSVWSISRAGHAYRAAAAPHWEAGMAQVSPAERTGGSDTSKWVYLFREGSAELRDLLGGKGAGVAGMTRAGLPVPPGFTITTQACNAYFSNRNTFPPGMWD